MTGHQLQLKDRIGVISFFIGLAWLQLICTQSFGRSTEVRPRVSYKSSPDQTLAVRIGKDSYTEEELLKEDNLALFEIKTRQYDLKMGRIQKLVVLRQIQVEANQSGTKLDEYIDKNIIRSDVAISEKEYKNFLAEKNIPFNQIDTNIRKQIISHMLNLKRDTLLANYAESLREKPRVEVYFAKPKLRVELNISKAITLGYRGAPVTIAEFSDFECPFCSMSAKIVHKLMDRYKGKIKLAVYQTPLSNHLQAALAAESSLCVEEQDPSLFWKYRDKLFENQHLLHSEHLVGHAKKVGVNLETYKKCMTDRKYSHKIQESIDYGKKIGVKTLPVFFINGRPIFGTKSIASFIEIIEEELR